MVVTALIIPHCPLLNAFLGHIKGNMNQSVLCPFRGKNSQLNGI